MSHVDDGELTAYADGAYPADDPVALRIGAHLSTCDNCRTRLELAHALRDRAAEVLGYATPARVQAPSFESLEARIATSPRKPLRTFPLAWAASIIMALGLGWFGRDFLQNPPERREIAVREAPSAAAPDDAGQPAQRSEAVTAPAPSSPPAPAPSEASQVAVGEARRERVAEQPAAEQAVAADRAGFTAGRASANAQVAAAAAPPPAAAAKVAGEDVSQRITAAEAERRGLDVPRIPELPIAHIALQGDTTAVVQSLPDGRLITLTVTIDAARARAQRDAAMEVAAPTAPQLAKTAADQPVVVHVRGKLIRVSGAMPTDSLRALARKIR